MRPTFADICRQFTLPDSKLLQWHDKDNAFSDGGMHKLGANLELANELYMDIQNRYLKEPVQLKE